MNTKLLNRLSLFFAALIVLPLMVFTITVCVKNSTPAEENTPSIEQPKDPNPQPEVEPENPTPETPSTPAKIVNGIYYFESTPTYSDICYTKDAKEVFKYFNTIDQNGINKQLNKLGFNEFLDNLTVVGNQAKYIEFSSNNKVSSYIFENSQFILINDNEFEYTYENSKYTSSGINPQIETDSTGKVITLSYPFYYELEDGTTEITPISVKVTLKYKTKSYESIAVNNAYNYFFVSNSNKFIYDFNKNINMDKVLSDVKTIFDLKDSTDVLKDVEKILSNYTYSINSNFTSLTLTDTSEGFKFSTHYIDNLTFTAMNSLEFTISNKLVDLESSKHQLTVDIKINSNVSMQFLLETI